MASLLEAQAEARAIPMPLMPCCKPMFPAAALGISIGTLSGLTRLGPRVWRTSSCLTIVSSPPTPVAKRTPMRSRLWSSTTSPAAAMASPAAATAELPEAIHPAGGAGVHAVGRVEALDLARDVRLQPQLDRVEASDAVDPGLPRLEAGPGLPHGVGEGVDRADPGDHHAPLVHARSSAAVWCADRGSCGGIFFSGDFVPGPAHRRFRPYLRACGRPPWGTSRPSSRSRRSYMVRTSLRSP